MGYEKKKWGKKKLWKKHKKKGRKKNNLGCCHLECIIPMPLKNSCCKQFERWMNRGEKRKGKINVDNTGIDFEFLQWIQSCWSLEIGHLLYDNAYVCWEVSSCCAAQLRVSTWWEHLLFFGINELPTSELSTLYQTHRETKFYIMNSGGSA